MPEPKPKDKPPTEEAPEMISVVVAQRRSLIVATPGGGQRVAKPGEQVEIPLTEVAHLRARGFLEGGPPRIESAPPAPIIDGPEPTVNGRPGTTYESV